MDANGQGIDIDTEEDKPPLHVFFDIESMQDTGCHIPNLLIVETEHDGCPVHFKGEQVVVVLKVFFYSYKVRIQHFTLPRSGELKIKVRECEETKPKDSKNEI